MRNLAWRFALVATLACLQVGLLPASEETQLGQSPAGTPPPTAPSPQASYGAIRDEPAGYQPSISSGGESHSPRSATPGADEFGRLLGYVTLLAALAGGAIYLIKFGLPMHRNRSKEERKLQVLEMRPLGNRQFLLVVAYEDTRMLLGVTPGKIDYLCPLDSPSGAARDFSQFVDQVEIKSSNT